MSIPARQPCDSGVRSRFAPGDGDAKTWRLEVRDDATPAQRGRLNA
jgi:hypothetical protein